METKIIIFRLFLVFVLSSIFGIERQKTNKPVGFGTFTFVAIGACGLAILTTDLYSANPFPLLGAIVTGIGFLGAGALIKTTNKIFGFTTAASIWLFAILGLIIGVGEYFIGLFMYAIVWVVLGMDYFLEHKGIGSYQKKIMIQTSKLVDEKELEDYIFDDTIKFKLIGIDMNNKNKRVSFTYLVSAKKRQVLAMSKKLTKKKWFESLKLLE